ncbi:MAG: VWA domain-containing protein [Trueperaceae bacterium]
MPHPRPLRRALPVLLTTVLALALASTALAQNCALEVEPNDTPATATPLDGRSCLVGALDDEQDAWWWEVDEEASGQVWQLELESFPGHLTKLDVFRVEMAANGDVTGAETLMTLGTSDGRQVRSEPLLIAPGRYLLGFSKSGGRGEYVLQLRAGDALSRGRTGFERLQDGGANGAFAGYGVLDGRAELQWTLDAEGSGTRWALTAQGALGTTLTLELLDPDGTRVGRASSGDDGRVDLRSLGLSAGEHRVAVEGSGPFTLAAVATGTVTDGDEVEPNDAFEQANLLTFDRPLRGTGTNTDYYVFDVGPEEADRPWDLHVETSDGIDVRLYDGDRTELQRRRGNGGVLRGLVLSEGSHYLYVSHDSTDAYTLRFEAGEALQEGFETEPNDTLATRDALSSELTVRGALAVQDRDVFRFSVEGAPQAWRVQAIGEGVAELAVYTAGGTEIARVRETGRPRIDQLVLRPGDHFVEVRGDAGAYALRLLAQGPAPEPPAAEATPDAPSAPLANAPAPPPIDDPVASGPPPPAGLLESEPNDDSSRAELLLAGTVRVGTLSGTTDRDTYRFFLPEDRVVRFEVASPEGGAVEFTVQPGSLSATPAELDGVAAFERTLLAGDYTVVLRDRAGGGGWYQLRMSFPDPLDRPADAEPNDARATAARVPAELAWDGTVGEARDEDVYVLPAFDVAATLTVAAELDAGITLFHDADGSSAVRFADGVAELALAPGGPQYLRLRGRGAYRLELAFDRPPDPDQLAAPAGDPRATAAFGADVATLQAYGVLGQQVDATVAVQNTSDEARRFALEIAVDHPTARVDAPASVDVPANGRVDVPVSTTLPPDLRDDLPITLTVGLRDASGITTAQQTYAPVCEAPPVGARPVWPLPEPLLGRFDVAWSGLGAIPVDASGDASRAIDGRVAPSARTVRDPETPLDVQLAGDGPVRVVGTVLHPLTNLAVARQLRRFEVWTSLDGTSFDLAHAGELKAARVAQAFVFDAPVTARFARLVFVDAQDGSTQPAIGSWQVIADDATDLGERNLADPATGGHVVTIEPDVNDASQILDDVARSVTVDGRREAVSFVVGFHHGRAAQVAHALWTADDDERGTRAAAVTVSASLDGSLGPWTELGTWPVAPTGTTTLDFDAPTWARFLRFDAHGHDAEERTFYLPSRVQVLERPVDDAYRSALGAWGYDASEASYEFHVGFSDVGAVDAARDDETADRAHRVASGDVATGTVAVAEDVDWLRVTVPEGENLLELRLGGDPALRYELQHADGTALVHDATVDGDERVLRAFVEPGDYLLKLEEPRRSVAFVWDNSGSMGPFIDITYNALARFARDVDPEREFVQLGVFDGPDGITWLLPYWSADPLRAQRALTEYDRSATSSNAFGALLPASRALGDRDGVRAILLITDAETGGQSLAGELWSSFDEVRPRIFTFEVSSAGSDVAQDLMQDWAYAAGGDYRLATSIGDLDAGFARTACLLRRPKAYRVEVTTAYEAPPGPGTLRVVRGEGAAQPAVEVIFDASGSMGQRLPSGASRIEVAKGVLEEFVRSGLPDDVPFALRAFGHITPNSCETRLDVRLAPLDRDAALSAVRAIEPKLFSQTPIAASIEAVAQDLAGSTGPKSILLITDGVESCDGDPQAAVEGLRAAGMDVQVSIVSLGLDDPADVAAFEALAEAVGASYVGTDDFDGLRDAVLAALAVPYQVLALDGTVVANGLVDGDPVELPAGSYRVRVGAELLETRVPGDGAVNVVTGR